MPYTLLNNRTKKVLLGPNGQIWKCDHLYQAQEILQEFLGYLELTQRGNLKDQFEIFEITSTTSTSTTGLVL